MKRDELLTSMAMELAEWPAKVTGAPVVNDESQWEMCCGYKPILILKKASPIFEEDWLQRRREMINEPDDEDAPDWANWTSQDESGDWYWYEIEPEILGIEWEAYGLVEGVQGGKIPAGHDWRKTLRRVNENDGAEGGSQTEEKTAENRTVEGKEGGSHAVSEDHDPVNHPKHYKLFPGLESIDVIQRSLTPEQFAGFCMGNALKYRMRAGEKGDAAQDLAKASWYRDKLAEVGNE